MRSVGSPRNPRKDDAAARNQASNSRLARITDTGTSLRDALALSSNRGASLAGQSSSASNRRTTPPRGPAFLAARSTALSSSPGLSSVDLAKRIGGGTSTASPTRTRSAIRRIRIGTEAASPWPSTMAANLAISVRPPRQRAAVASHPLGRRRGLEKSDSAARVRPRYTSDRAAQTCQHHQGGRSA